MGVLPAVSGLVETADLDVVSKATALDLALPGLDVPVADSLAAQCPKLLIETTLVRFGPIRLCARAPGVRAKPPTLDLDSSARARRTSCGLTFQPKGSSGLVLADDAPGTLAQIPLDESPGLTVVATQPQG